MLKVPAMSESPIDTDEDVRDLKATEAFQVLGNETRLGNLIELWGTQDLLEQDQPNPAHRTALTYSQPRERVGYDTSSNFHYHLEQLLGSFVQKTEEGYELLPAGDTIVHAIVASAGFVDRTIPLEEVSQPCPKCGEATAITYQTQRLLHCSTACEGIYGFGDDISTGVLGG